MIDTTLMLAQQKSSLDRDAKRMGGAEFAVKIANVVQVTVVNEIVDHACGSRLPGCGADGARALRREERAMSVLEIDRLADLFVLVLVVLLCL